MSTRPDIYPRYFPDSPQVGDLAVSVQEALDTVPLVSFRRLDYTASGTAGTAMPAISWGETSPSIVANPTSPPDVALVVRAQNLSDTSGDVGAVSPRLNFDFQSSRTGVHSVILYEPSGLTANASYRLTVMFLAGL